MSSLASKSGPRIRHVTGEEEPYETISVEKLTPIIGAEITGVDIGKLVSDERSNRQMDEIHRALAENVVIFFRDQHITPQQHLAFGRRFGELHIHPAAPHEDGELAYRGLYANYGVADKQAYPRAEHPVVRTHPVTAKKALYVNRGFTSHIIGLPRDESDAILRYLYEHCENPLFQCRFRWTENAIAFWDNRCAQHRAMWDYWPHTRSGNRVTVKGERPV